ITATETIAKPAISRGNPQHRTKALAPGRSNTLMVIRDQAGDNSSGIIEGNAVRLADRGFVQMIPVLRAVAGDVDSAVAFEEHTRAISFPRPPNGIGLLPRGSSRMVESLSRESRLEQIPRPRVGGESCPPGTFATTLSYMP